MHNLRFTHHAETRMLSGDTANWPSGDTRNWPPR